MYISGKDTEDLVLVLYFSDMWLTQEEKGNCTSWQLCTRKEYVQSFQYNQTKTEFSDSEITSPSQTRMFSDTDLEDVREK